MLPPGNGFNTEDEMIKSGGSGKASEKTWHPIKMLKAEQEFAPGILNTGNSIY